MDKFVLKRTAPQGFDAAETSRPLRLRQDNVPRQPKLMNKFICCLQLGELIEAS